MSETVSTGRRLGRYRLAQVIGQGGMGVVHLALDDQGIAVAIKVLRPHVAGDPDARERLAREVDTLTRVRSPRVAEVLDADVDCETPYVVTRYVPASALDHHVAERGPLAGERLARLGLGLGEALAAIHAVDVVHRDLKPGNVLMLEGDPVVIDFGIAHVADDIRLTSTGLVMGTPGYLSPELVEGAPVRQAADWWGWAATMTFAATGRPPFGRGPLEVVLDRVRRGAADLDGVPAVLVPVLAAALSPSPDDRPKPGALRRAVEQLRTDALARPPAPPREAATQVIPAVGVHPRAPVTEPVPHVLPPPPQSATGVLPFVPPTRALPLTAPTRAGTGWQGTPEPVRRPVPHPFPPVAVRPRPTAPPSQASPASQASQPFGGLLPLEGEPPPPPPPPPKPHRTGTTVSGFVLLVCLATVLPLGALALAVTWMLLARTVDGASGTLLRRRYERGLRRGDSAMAVLSSPWHLLVQLLLAVPVLLLPALVGASAAFIPGLFVSISDWPWGTALTLATAAVVGGMTAWWGLGGGALRRGSRQLSRGLAPGRTGATLAVVVLLSLAVAAVVVLVAGGWVPEWFPLDAQPVLVP